MNWKKATIYLAGFAVIFSLSAYLSFVLLGDRFTLEMPEFVGRDLSEASGMVKDLALTITVTGEEFDREIPEGYVLEQSVQAGTLVRGQSSVELIISKGPEVRLIPLVTGMEFEDALDLLEEKELAVQRSIKVHTGGVAQGKVLAQFPAPDEWTGESLTLVVSAGPPDIVLYTPYFLGMNRMDAIMLARDLGLSVRISELDNSDVISYQSPLPGAEINRGEVLKLRVGG